MGSNSALLQAMWPRPVTWALWVQPPEEHPIPLKVPTLVGTWLKSVADGVFVCQDRIITTEPHSLIQWLISLHGRTRYYMLSFADYCNTIPKSIYTKV